MNLVIKNAHWNEEIEKALFSDEKCIRVPESESFDMFDLLVLMKVFPSKSQAKKNWKKTGKDFEPGFNTYIVGKTRQQVWIWNPIPHQENA